MDTTLQGVAFATLTVLNMAAFTLVLRAAVQVWPVGLAILTYVERPVPALQERKDFPQ